ncbi:hypothetical protein D9619_011969 [Psilocybe cf. subviscida]|uniref:Uncharacterized protein n=1 Tax=Psilocybe cf. subviscida TaxID=2480587 RepID=A0A8H5B0D7_9AGAR|nr:hypothetical protein D9619_011969 [Psilocybe cf. subviscida]
MAPPSARRQSLQSADAEIVLGDAPKRNKLKTEYKGESEEGESGDVHCIMLEGRASVRSRQSTSSSARRTSLTQRISRVRPQASWVLILLTIPVHPAIREECKQTSKCAPLMKHFGHLREEVANGEGFKAKSWPTPYRLLTSRSERASAPRSFHPRFSGPDLHPPLCHPHGPLTFSLLTTGTWGLHFSLALFTICVPDS